MTFAKNHVTLRLAREFFARTGERQHGSSIEDPPSRILHGVFQSRILNRRSSIEDPPSRILHRGSSIEDPPSRILHRGSSIEDYPSRIIHRGSSIDYLLSMIRGFMPCFEFLWELVCCADAHLRRRSFAQALTCATAHVCKRTGEE